MRESLAPGLALQFRYRVPADKTVPHVYPEAALFREMPEVFATAFLVGLFEWACIEAMQPHLDPGERSVGTSIAITHTAATPPGLVVTVDVKLLEVAGRRLRFSVRADDGIDPIGEGIHERFVIDRERFDRKVEAKRAATPAPASA